ncbi:hypothetical protein CMI37_26200 [Candidatus Pacearchaeota archaeon]|nr:hypothetical protein [Candidatus Pacearchaeota archaeon]|tara:strand:- start:5470 stop:6312 length:843 start_codon:yes stop_codon:yes gene_type:complete
MQIVLTGHKGLIGSYLKKRLEAEEHNIVVSIDKRAGSDLNFLENLDLHGKVDLVIHAAAHCKINQSVEDPLTTYENNVSGTFKVLEFCRKNKVPKIIFFSSSRILSPEKNPYTASKIYGEELCKAYSQCYGIEYIIIRPSTVYGPFWDLAKRLMHIFIVNALTNKDIEIYGNPETKTLDFTYIDDFIDGVMLALKNPGWNKEYDLSGNEEQNLLELAQFIIAQTKSRSKILIKGEEVAQPQKVSVDISAIAKLGYTPKVLLREGVVKTIEWYRDYLKDKD